MYNKKVFQRQLSHFSILHLSTAFFVTYQPIGTSKVFPFTKVIRLIWCLNMFFIVAKKNVLLCKEQCPSWSNLQLTKLGDDLSFSPSVLQRKQKVNSLTATNLPLCPTLFKYFSRELCKVFCFQYK